MAPEQLLGESVDEACDIFSAGAVLYEMATGFRAFPQRDLARLVEAIQHEMPRRPSLLNVLVPETLDALILRTLEKNPAARPPSALALAESLERLAE
jgi:serine/threonine-protein kinase